MRKGEYIFAIDLGTHSIKSLVGEILPNLPLQIVAQEITPSAGIRKGTVVDIEETRNALSTNLENLSKKVGERVNSVICSLGGTHIEYTTSKGVVAISRADGKVTKEDVERVIKAAEAISLPTNKEILHIFPREFILDKEGEIKDPVGMEGVRLEAECSIILAPINALRNLERVFELLNVEIDEVIFSGLAASEAILSKRQKELGCLLVDIGGFTTTLSVWEEGELIHTRVLPIGAGHITNDIAIAFQLPIDIAEKLKIRYGSTLPTVDIGKKEKIDLHEIDEKEGKLISRKEMLEVIDARVSEICDLINEELKKISRAKLLPAGIILCGGGAKLPGMVEFFKRKLKLPCEIGYPSGVEGIVDRIDDPSFGTVVGLLNYYLKQSPEAPLRSKRLLKDKIKQIKNWLRELLP
jgi:cell division protein FtsA